MTVKPLVASEKRDTPKPGPFTKWRQQSFEDTEQTEEQVFVRTRHSWIHSGIDACGNVQPHMEMRIVYTIVMASHLIVAIVRLRLKESKVAEKTKLKVARAYPNASQEGTRAWKIAPKSIRDLFSGLIIRFAFTLPQFLFLLARTMLSESAERALRYVIRPSLSVFAYGNYLLLSFAMPLVGFAMLISFSASQARFADIVPLVSRGKVTGSMNFFAHILVALGGQ